MVINSRPEVGLCPDLFLKELDRLFERFHEPLDLENNARLGTVSENRIIGSMSEPPLVNDGLSKGIPGHPRLWAVRVDDATARSPQLSWRYGPVKKRQEVLLSPVPEMRTAGFNFVHRSREARHGVYGSVDQRNGGHDAFAVDASVYACENTAL